APVPADRPLLLRSAEGGRDGKVADVVKQLQGGGKGKKGGKGTGGGLGGFRGDFEADRLSKAPAGSNGTKADPASAWAAGEALGKMKTLDNARELLRRRELEGVQSGKLGVELSEQTSSLRQQQRVSQTAVRRVQNRNLLEVGGVWIDEGFDAKMK